MKKGLLLIAHGSPRKEANLAFAGLATTIQQQTPDHVIQHAFLDIDIPKIPEGIKALYNQGIKEIIVLPYFLSEGKHTTLDIPEIIEDEKTNYPDLIITIKDPIGLSPEMVNFILRLI